MSAALSSNQGFLPLRSGLAPRDTRPGSTKASAALDSPLVGWTAWELHVDCGAPFCSRSRRFAVVDLVRRLGGATVEGALGRMRCDDCRGGVKVAELVRPAVNARQKGSLIRVRG